MIISKQFRFEASHQIFNHPGKCSRLHGHSWLLTVSVDGPVQGFTGMVMDFFDLKTHVQPVIDRLDHTHLGSGDIYIASTDEIQWIGPSHELSLPKLPTSENLLLWIAEQLYEKGFQFATLRLNETCTSEAELNWHEFLLHMRRKEHKEHEERNSKSKIAESQRPEERKSERQENKDVAETRRFDRGLNPEITDDDIPF